MTAAVEAVDELGTPVRVPRWPQRIVSLVPSLSETLWWARAADRVVGVTEWCVAPPHGFPRAQRVRGTKNPDVRAIAALAPDLVVANEEENRELDVRRLREAGLSVYVTAPRTVEQARDSVADVAALVGAPDAGRELAVEIDRALVAIRAARPDPPLATLCPIWRDPWMVVGRATYAADLLAHCGLAVLAPDPDDRYPKVELEEARGWAPEAVLLPDEPYRFETADKRAFDGWHTRVRLIDGAQLTWYGPRVPYALRELTRLARGLARRR